MWSLASKNIVRTNYEQILSARQRQEKLVRCLWKLWSPRLALKARARAREWYGNGKGIILERQFHGSGMSSYNLRTYACHAYTWTYWYVQMTTIPTCQVASLLADQQAGVDHYLSTTMDCLLEAGLHYLSLRCEYGVNSLWFKCDSILVSYWYEFFWSGFDLRIISLREHCPRKTNPGSKRWGQSSPMWTCFPGHSRRSRRTFGSSLSSL